MTEREHELARFLEGTGWGGAAVCKLAGDVSHRRYFRLTRPEGSRCVLMDAPAATCGSLEPFVRLTRHLRGIGLSAPEILDGDDEAGFLLLEDLGDDLFARIMARQPDLEQEIYRASVEVLVEMQHARPPRGIPDYSPKVQADLATLSFEWYARYGGIEPIAHDLIEEFRELVGAMIVELGACDTFQHRDYHAENLLWLPGRKGTRRVGVLDYQTASMGRPAYDLVSILEDARRDVSTDLQAMLLDYYCELTNLHLNDLMHEYSVCGAQRNLRIIGLFARLAVRDGNPRYLKFVPRVWNHLKQDLAHPSVARLASLVCRYMHPPTPDILAKLQETRT